MFYFHENEIATDEEISKMASFEIFEKKIPAYKITIIGNDGVGKTTLKNNHLSSIFNSDSSLTIGCDFSNKLLTLYGLRIRLQFWLVSSEDRFRFLISNYLLGSSLVIVMFDLTNFNTLSNLREYISMIRRKDKEIPIILVGNKLDLKKNRDIPNEMIIELFKDKKLFAYYEISSKTGENVEKLFELIVRIVLKRIYFEKIRKEKE